LAREGGAIEVASSLGQGGGALERRPRRGDLALLRVAVVGQVEQGAHGGVQLVALGEALAGLLEETSFEEREPFLEEGVRVGRVGLGGCRQERQNQSHVECSPSLHSIRALYRQR